MISPGPWMMLQSVGDGDSYWTRIETEEGGPVAMVMTKQDARLIAAAPELVEALDGMVKVACSSCCCCGEYARALEVIKKARGEA